MDMDRFCLKCMCEEVESDGSCSHCGFIMESADIHSNALPAPSILHGRYYIGLPLGIGGFGITYIAYDMKIGGICAIKEYMPDTVSYRIKQEASAMIGSTKAEIFEYGLSRFMEEAEILKQFSSSKNVINVFDSFYENGTAYYVMEYINGHDLTHEIERFKSPGNFSSCLSVFMQVLDGLEEIHSRGLIHRDISPDNLYITANEIVKVLDFGAARYAVSQESRDLSVIIKAGYAPLEQYQRNNVQGPWTDIYALCATFYLLLSGVMPVECIERIENDSLIPLIAQNQYVPAYFSDMISKGLSLKKEERFASVQEIRNIISSNLSVGINPLIPAHPRKEPLIFAPLPGNDLSLRRILENFIDCAVFGILFFFYNLLVGFIELQTNIYILCLQSAYSYLHLCISPILS